MKLYKGWLRLEKDETIRVNLLEIKRTNKGFPYAVCKDNQGKRFNVNIKETDALLGSGEYQLHCTNVNENGYCYVEFNEVVDIQQAVKEWENHDTILQAESYHDDIRVESIKVSLRITEDYQENIEYTNPTIDEAIQTIQSQLYEALGQMTWRREK